LGEISCEDHRDEAANGVCSFAEVGISFSSGEVSDHAEEGRDAQETAILGLGLPFGGTSVFHGRPDLHACHHAERICT